MAPRSGIPQPVPDDAYLTPPDTRRDLLDRLGLGNALWFYALQLRVVLRSRSLALKGRYDDAAWVRASWEILRSLERCGARFHISGLDHVRAVDGPVVFVSNHMSTAETQVFPCLIAPIKPVTFIVKRSLTTMPLFGPVMRSRDPITVGRTNPREDMVEVMTEGTRRLQAGTSVIVFPQATRHQVFQPARFNSLGVKVAGRAGVPVIPVAVKTDFWRPGRGWRKDLGTLDRSLPVHMEFGAPLAVDGNGKAQHEAIVEFIRERLLAWGGAVQDGRY
jgi:1-acyl-sn-glycerol-3-phosphate acyltransferase